MASNEVNGGLWHLGLLLQFLLPVFSTHFRGAKLWYEPAQIQPPDDNQTYTLDFHLEISWRRNFSGSTFCDENTIASGKLVGPNSPGYIICKEGCNSERRIGSVLVYCNEFSETENFISGWNTFRHTFDSSTTNFTLVWEGEGWLENLRNGRDEKWALKLTGTIDASADTSINSSPQSTSSLILYLRQGCSYSISLPIEDPDGDVVRCRWASGKSECGGVCRRPDYVILDEEACQIDINATELGHIALTMQLEDFISSSSQTPRSSVPLQFVMQVYQASVGSFCNVPPKIISPTNTTSDCQLPTTLQVEVQTTDQYTRYESTETCLEWLLGPIVTDITANRNSRTITVTFSEQISRPSSNRYITLYSEEGVELGHYRWQDLQIDPPSTASFTMPTSAQMEGSYYILMQEGVVQGSSNCNALSPAITDKTQLMFNVDGGGVSPSQIIPLTTASTSMTTDDFSNGGGDGGNDESGGNNGGNGANEGRNGVNGENGGANGNNGNGGNENGTNENNQNGNIDNGREREDSGSNRESNDNSDAGITEGSSNGINDRNNNTVTTGNQGSADNNDNGDITNNGGNNGEGGNEDNVNGGTGDSNGSNGDDSGGQSQGSTTVIPPTNEASTDKDLDYLWLLIIVIGLAVIAAIGIIIAVIIERRKRYQEKQLTRQQRQQLYFNTLSTSGMNNVAYSPDLSEVKMQ